jgi:hypothetical protein
MDFSHKMTAKEAAEYLGHSTHWLTVNRKRLGIPHYAIGGYVFFLKTDLDNWIIGQQNDAHPRRKSHALRSTQPIVL